MYENPSIQKLVVDYGKSLSLDIPNIFIHFKSIDRVFNPTDLRKEREHESLYRRH